MGNTDKNLTRLLLIGCVLGSVFSLPAQAGGNGTIVLQRDVQPIPIGRKAAPDPYPTTVNANPSERIVQTTNHELSDGDFASISSGASINGAINPNTNGLPGLNVVTNPNGLPGMSSGHGGGSGGAISGTINRSLSSGLAPLGRLAGGQ
jgi:hypothetical protein